MILLLSDCLTMSYFFKVRTGFFFVACDTGSMTGAVSATDIEVLWLLTLLILRRNYFGLVI